MKLLKNCKYVYDGNKVLEDKNIIIKEDKIKDVKDQIPSSIKFDQIIDCQNHAIFPSLFNSHNHSAMIFLRSYKDDLSFHNWLKNMLNVEENISEKLIYESSIIAIYEMIKTGTAGFFDMYYFPKETKKACEDIGIFSILSSKEEFNESNFVKQARLLHSIYSEDEETLKKQAKISKEKNQLINIHISETRKEINDCYKKHNMYPVEYLNKINLLSDRLVGSHVSWVTKKEIKMLKKNKCKVVTCPTSNMKLSTGGTLQYKEFKKHEIPILLGTDSVASNNNLNLIEEAKIFSLIQKHSYWDSSIINSKESMNTAINGWNLIKRYGVKSGKIKKGYKANLFGVSLKETEMIPSFKDNVISNLIYGTPNIDFHYINGIKKYDSNMKNGIEKRVKKAKKVISEFAKKEMI